MSEYSAAITELRTAPQQAAVGNIDGSPDDAARALELERSTGTPASAIYGDLEGFEQKTKSALAGGIVANNPQLQDYINKHPLAAPLSNDDYGNLDEASRQASRFKRFLATQGVPGLVLATIPDAAREGWHKMVEAWGEPGGNWAKLEDIQNYPITTAAVMTAELPIRALSAIMGGVAGAAKGGAQSLYETATGDPSGAARFGRDIGAMTEMMLQGGGPHGVAPGGPKQMEAHIRGLPPIKMSPAQVEAFNAAKPWVDSGVEPPRGLHPEIDKLKADRNTADMRELDESLKMATKSGTRERAPDMYAGFMRQHFGEAKIGISGERIVELYKEKVPEAEDGLFGWVPGIKEQLEAARETGQDIQVPIADWLAKVDPAVAKELKDDIRVRPGNITKAEVELEKKGPELVVAREMPDGTTRYGKPGQIHADLIDAAELKADPFFPPPDSTMGFAEPGGKFLSRDEALARTKEREPERAQRANPYGFQAENYNDVRPIPIDAPLAQVRGSSSLEPLFSIGDRKLELKRETKKKFAGAFGEEAGFHDFNMVDENGRTVGALNISVQKGGKTIYVEDITGVNGIGPRDIGPSLMRNLFRQIAHEFPEAEWITGHRVSGMRDRFGTYNEPSAFPKLDLRKLRGEVRFTDLDLNEMKAFHDELKNGFWINIDKDLKYYIRPSKFLEENETKIIDAVTSELKRIIPDIKDIRAADVIEARGKSSVGGVYFKRPHSNPTVIWSLSSADPVGVGRHEAIHYLRQNKFFAEAEWNTLAKAAKEEGWINEKIERNYGRAEPDLKIEEAVADAFREWAKSKDSLVTKGKEALALEGPIARIFRKLQDFLDAIAKRFKEILGHEPTWEELFESAFKGEIGKREGGQPLNPEAFRLSVEDRADMLRANATGLDLVSFKRLQKLIEARHEEDFSAAMKRAEREQRKRQSTEWKEKATAIRPQVVDDIKSRPDVAADLFLTSGEVYGQKLGEGFRIRTDDLTPEQAATLPRQYLRKDGIPADEVANMFGFKSREELIQSLAEYNALRKESGKNPDLYRRQLIDDEVQRRMEREEGFLEKNILEEARDQALSQTQLDLLAEEMHAAGMMAKVATIDKNVAKAWAEDAFSKLRVGDISSDHFMTLVGRYGRDAERALIANKPAEAVQLMQKKFINALMAKQAKELETAVDQLAKQSRKYLRQDVKGVDLPFVDHIQQLLAQAGYKVRKSPEDIARGMEFHGANNLPDFVRSTADLGWEPVVADWMQNKGAKPLETMTAAEFGEFKDAITSLDWIGRQINKIEIAGEKAEFDAFRKDVIGHITQLPARSRESQGRWLYNIDASLTRMEEMVKDLDLREQLGPLWRAVIEPMTLSKSKEYDLQTKLKEHFEDTKGSFDKKWRKSLADSIPQDIIWDPYTQTAFDMTRENLLQIMLNWGNRSNIDKYVSGAGWARWGVRLTREQMAVYEGQIKALIDKHATKEDWDFVQRMWEPFKGWQKEMDIVSRNTSGVAPKWIEPSPVQTPHGTFDGGYWPVKYDRLGSNIKAIEEAPGKEAEGVFGKNYFRAATSKGYLKERTGYVDFVDISTSVEQAVGTMQQTIHDIAFRDALIQSSKVFYDRAIRAAIRKHYGAEYEAQLVPWLKRIAYQFSTDDASIRGWNDFLRRARINLVGHSLPLNLKVILSPDVGVPNPAAWARFESNRSANMALALEKSNELRHLVYSLDRDYNDALNKITIKAGTGDLGTIQKKAIEWGYKPVAKVSQEFRASTFIDTYNKALEQGLSDHDAVLLADSTVRERHGAASVVDLPAALQSNEGLKMLTIFQGYFNTMYNWQRQIPGMVRRGDVGGAAEAGLGSVIVGAFFGAALFNQQKKDDSWFKTIAKALTIQPLSTVPILNSVASFAFEGFSPRMPYASMLTSVGQVISDTKKIYRGERAEKPITHGANVVGLSTGLPLAQIGRTSQFSYDIAKGYQRPRNIGEWARGIITGEARLK